MKRKSFTDLIPSKSEMTSQEKINMLNKIVEDIDISFDRIFNIAKLDEIIKSTDKRLIDITNKLESIEWDYNKNPNPSNEIKELYDDGFSSLYEKEEIEIFLIEIEKMKIVFLHIYMEKALKNIFSISFLEKSIEKTYKWDDFISDFKNKKIDIVNFSTYNKVNDIKNVSNNIKHNSELINKSKIGHISEFKSQKINDVNNTLNDLYIDENKYFTVNNLQQYFINNRNKLKPFFNELIKEIVSKHLSTE